VIWRLITPRQLRRWTLAVLVAWLVTAVSYQNGVLSPAEPQAPPATFSFTTSGD